MSTYAQLGRRDGDTREDLLTNVLPTEMKTLRACVKCHLVKTVKQFMMDGCNNCLNWDSATGGISQEESVQELTTIDFDGVIGMMKPGLGDQKSWVSQWQNIAHCVPGCYAVAVSGRLAREFDRIPITVEGQPDESEASDEDEDGDFNPDTEGGELDTAEREEDDSSNNKNNNNEDEEDQPHQQEEESQ